MVETLFSCFNVPNASFLVRRVARGGGTWMNVPPPVTVLGKKNLDIKMNIMALQRLHMQKWSVQLQTPWIKTGLCQLMTRISLSHLAGGLQGH